MSEFGPEDPFAQAAGLRVVSGSPDEAELAALVAGVVAVTSANADDDAPGSPTSAWMDRTRTLRGSHRNLPLGRGDGAWRHSLR
ncbi:acyl-CoA carboxylase epsilon subunit [Demequina sp. B12]|uniref:acyl-CoA carboxylase epsilon subunit n=1 Tax=Demequina sp. B12 TaxID=2992757 RepID=UPI00237AE9FF|nr:acyl-CoA carboxylase epsilon subunit [Demequina sp. B12]MDE0573611.1 acyl-CoA carboxylase epsilon subunit [Demequina sp. B12]